jgi:hypothetical protein
VPLDVHESPTKAIRDGCIKWTDGMRLLRCMPGRTQSCPFIKGQQCLGSTLFSLYTPNSLKFGNTILTLSMPYCACGKPSFLIPCIKLSRSSSHSLTPILRIPSSVVRRDPRQNAMARFVSTLVLRILPIFSKNQDRGANVAAFGRRPRVRVKINPMQLRSLARDSRPSVRGSFSNAVLSSGLSSRLVARCNIM